QRLPAGHFAKNARERSGSGGYRRKTRYSPWLPPRAAARQIRAFLPGRAPETRWYTARAKPWAAFSVPSEPRRRPREAVSRRGAALLARAVPARRAPWQNTAY